VDRWTYYSPLLGGAAVGALGAYSLAEGAVLYRIGVVLLAAAVTGLVCQLLMIAAQGAFAKVVPVPVGRSIRGNAAMWFGRLWLVGAGFAVVPVLMLLTEAADEVSWAGKVLFYGTGIISIACALGGVGLYIWNLPVAVRDFVDD
jgi:hypothetical protein